MTRFRIIRFRESKVAKGIAVLITVEMLNAICFPSVSWALTSGPSQEEFASFEPASTSDMVDLYSGDFTYNIPVMNVPGPNGGYPINLSYHGGIGMEQEASWVGLGWNINVGAINRQMQGIPDDFNGEEIDYKMHAKESFEIGISTDLLALGSSGSNYAETYGFPSSVKSSNKFLASLNGTLYYNNYKGIGYRVVAAPKLLSQQIGQIGTSVGISFDSQNGIGISPSVTLDMNHFSMGISANYNSRQGLTSIGASTSLRSSFPNYTKDADKKTTKNPNKLSGSITASSSMGFAAMNYLPNVQIPFINKTNSFAIRLGNTSALGDWDAQSFLDWSGYYTISKNVNNGEVSENAYGYLYEHGQDGLKDFARENILQTKKTPYLAPSKNTYDWFIHTGQGTGGNFRANKDFIEVLSNSDKTTETKNNDFGLEGAIGSFFHIGLDYTRTKSTQFSGDWTSGDDALDDLESFSNPYFKVYGEQSGVLTSENNMNNWGGDNALSAHVQKDSENWLEKGYELSGYFDEQFANATTNGEYASSLTETKSSSRRGKGINFLTVSEAKLIGTYRDADFLKPSNLISEIQVNQQDGMRYMYGQPAYNNNQVNVTTSVPDVGTLNLDRVNVDATSYLDNSTAQAKEYLNRSEMPEYANSWLLTSVLSSDYIDADYIPGPSDGDFGYWTKFNYTQKYSDYKWRVPYAGATFIEGSEGNVNDNMASFSYGTKEVYYVESIETRTHMAKFYLSDREDGLEAHSEYAIIGAQGSRALQQLDSIQLYTKIEYDGGTNPNAVPLQTVHFDYSYELCEGAYNSSSTHKGKLTLDKMYFTYQFTSRGEYSSYGFDYGQSDPTLNPPYDSRDIDRWGNYKNNDQYSANYPYVDFPSTEQDSEFNNSTNTGTEVLVENNKPGLWCLREVTLPTGGVFNIEYEHDDYAYEENKKATRMFDIVAIGNSDSYSGSSLETAVLYSDPDETAISGSTDLGRDMADGQVLGSLDNFLEDGNDKVFRIYFKLERPIVGSTSDSDLNDSICSNYVGDLSHLYFKTSSYLRKESSDNPLYKDYVSGYAELENGVNRSNSLYFGALKMGGSSDFNIGYVSVKPVSIGEAGADKVHPFKKAAIEHIRVNRPEIAYGVIPNTGTPSSQVFGFIASTLSSPDDVMQMILGYNRWANVKGWGEYIDLNGKSIIKLQDPDGFKIGGGDRVKNFTLSDGWTDESQYGQEYSYTIEENGKTISSGVAYEPLLGKEESALTSYLQYSESTPLASPYNLMIEEPLLRSYYPSSTVGYSQVTVRSIAPKRADIESTLDGIDDDDIVLANNSAPISKYKFYTGRDFPVYFDVTDLDPSPNIFRIIPIPGIAIDMRIKKAKSQGFSVVLNDMPGKLKSTESYTRKYAQVGSKRVDVLGNLITKTEYIYNTDNIVNGGSKSKLNNEVPVIVSDMNFDKGIIGETVDIHIDKNETSTLSKSYGLNLNLEFIAPIIFIVPIPIPQYYRNEINHKTVATNKVIHRSGILKSTKITTDASAITTKNLAFDLLTGEALLTETFNEYNDPVYNYSIPARFAYDEIGEVYDRMKIFTGAVSSVSGGLVSMSPTDASKYKVGDNVYLLGSGSPYSGAISAHVVDVSSSGIKCIANDGSWVDDGTITLVKMVRPVERNMLTSKVGGVVFKDLQDFIGVSGTFDFDDIISANAVEYSNIWQTVCDDCDKESNPEGNSIDEDVNPYRNGVIGNWRVRSGYAYRDSRDYSNDARDNGYFSSFSQFNWLSPSSSSSNWLKSNEITKYSPYGFELEEKDALGNYSSAVYGYNNTMLTALGSNMRYNEIAFDGFEDYPADCNENHFSFNFDVNPSVEISDDFAHSGQNSLKLGSSVTTANYTFDGFLVDSCENHSPVFDVEGIEYYEVDECDCVGKFAPSRKLSGGSKKYVISAWVRENHLVSNFDDVYINVVVTNAGGGPITTAIYPSGRIIEGWQRIYGEFDLPNDFTALDVTYLNGSGVDAYLDDLRIHPFDGNMKSMVYDPISYRLEAELDANNFATFYIYDESGNLNLIKKETSEGIKTIKEGRVSSPRN